MDDNPYASPRLIDEPVASIPSGGRDAARRRLAVPANALMALSALAFLGELYLSVLVASSIPSQYGIRPFWITVFANGGGALLMLLHFVIYVGASQMRRAESRAWARTAAMLAIVPLVSPFLILGVPFGIWALRLMSKPGINGAFEFPADARGDRSSSEALH